MKCSRSLNQVFAVRSLEVVLLAMIVTPCIAAEPPDFARCARIASDTERLKCYDGLAGRDASAPGPAQPEPAAPAAPAPARPAPGAEPLEQLGTKPSSPTSAGAGQPGALSTRWELDPETKQGVWNVRPYQPLFLLPVRTSSRPNGSPQSPSHPFSGSLPLDHAEAEFQLSAKVKAWQDMLSSKADLWFAYTQQSQWQVYNGGISRPFRETNYEPEIFTVFPAQYRLLGLEGRFVSLGLLHQSNGRGNPLSRSWNRIYLRLGFERGGFSLLVRPWYRLKESTAHDDNPDINRYMGYGDVLAVYKWDRQEFSLLGRYNAGTGYGALQGTWSFPIHERLKGYVKAFTGYGETLIDYNWKQSTIGIGISLADWL